MLYSSFIKDSTRLLEYWRFELVAHTFQAVPSQEPRNSKLPGLRAHTSLVLGLRVQGLGFKVRGGFSILLFGWGAVLGSTFRRTYKDASWVEAAGVQTAG